MVPVIRLKNHSMEPGLFLSNLSVDVLLRIFVASSIAKLVDPMFYILCY